MALKLLKQNKSFGGWVKQYSHESVATKTTMTFSIFLPEAGDAKLPVLYFLSGLTCTDQNFITKAGAQKAAAEYGIALVAPDTSPRGTDIPGEHDNWDFGSGAGFYVNATTDAYKTNYNMYEYVVNELPSLISKNFTSLDGDKKSVCGHSMGGHGALITALKNPGSYKSASSFSAICHPSACPWGNKAFTGYLGEDKETWKAYDATELIKGYNGEKLNILNDQGGDDEFLTKKQLLPEDLEEAAKGNTNVELTVNIREGYDHSYYFIASFIEDHIKFHAQYLC